MIFRQLTVAALTDVGRRRDHNEDAYGIAEELGLYVVCDGMGGHASGEVASRMTVDHMLDFARRTAAGDQPSLPHPVAQGCSQMEALLSNAVQHANDRVYIEGMKDSRLEGMGTTVVSVLANEDQLVLGHVGDSRVYRYRIDAGELEQVTRDHSLLNHKIDMGELSTPDEIAGFKQGNIIVRAIGLKDYVAPETQIVPRRPREVFLLCSDGLSDMVDDWSIQLVLEANSDDLEEAARALVQMANDRGGKDNITVMLVRVDDVVAAEESTDPGLDVVGPTERSLDTIEEEEVTDPRGIQVDDELLAFHEMETDPGRPAVKLDGDHIVEVPPPAPPPPPPPSVQVQVQTGAAAVPASHRRSRRRPADEQPSIIVEQPSIIIDYD